MASSPKAASRYGKKAAAKAAAQKAVQPAQTADPAVGQDQDEAQAAQMMQRYGGG